MLLIYPPSAKACEAPAGIARLAGTLKANGHACTLLDANLEGTLYLLHLSNTPSDTWSTRAYKHLEHNLQELKTPKLYQHTDRYRRVIADLNRVMEINGRPRLGLNLANYQDRELSPLKSEDLLRSAEHAEDNIFFPYFSERLSQLINESQPKMIGFSLNYLSQALCTFAMIGFCKQQFPEIQIVAGGGLITSWLRNPNWHNPFTDLIDHLIAGPGERPLLELLNGTADPKIDHCPDYQGLPITDYLAPGFILPYAASSGCYWNKCSFCPERAEENPYLPLPIERVLDHLKHLTRQFPSSLIHFLDNAISPALLQGLAKNPPGADWYGFVRVSPLLADPEFCQSLRQSGCVMLKLGIESGDQNVLNKLDKGINLTLVSQVLNNLRDAGIATYVYLLFGTPPETITEARRTLKFIVNHHDSVTFLNLAIFNMPLGAPDTHLVKLKKFYNADLGLYTDFVHPQGWERQAVRRFLDQEFKRHPIIAKIMRRDPPLFTSNHAPFVIPHTKQQR